MQDRPGCILFTAFLALLTLGPYLVAGSTADVCPRPASGGTVMPTPEVRSSNGRVHVGLALRGQVDDYGLNRYCYIDEDGVESPTIRVWPGDEVVLDLKNKLTPKPAGASPSHQHAGNGCSAGPMTAVSTNLHFHGLAITSSCHQDDVIHTSVQPFEPAFQYRFKIPADQSAGLYWYHPHPHGYSERQVLGGASGALIVEGIAQVKPQVAGLSERVLILRDQMAPKWTNAPGDQDDVTGKDTSVNFVPMMYPLYRPAVIRVRPDRKEFWRVLNASADTYFNLEVNSVENGQRVPLDLQLIAVDGAPTADEVSALPRAQILISPGARAEFIVTTPHAGALSQLVSRNYDTGPDGAANSNRVLANILSGNTAPETQLSGSVPSTAPVRWRFNSLAGIRPVRVRKLYFSEDRQDLKAPGKPAKYFITVEGKEPTLFDMNFKEPDITVRQGTMEDWVIENRAREAHVFHIHQLHFQLLERDGTRLRSPCCATRLTFLTGTERARGTRASGCGWISVRRKSWEHFSSTATSWNMKMPA